ncbi:MAG: hypothetical protein WD669_00810 [Pirellulales bacterium]
MRTTWHSLAWKEWHEHKWKLASIVAIIWALTAYNLLVNRGEIDVIQSVAAVGMVCLLPLSVFVGLGDAAGERSQNTLPFLQALPVSTQRAAAAKLVFGLVTVIAPILLTWLFVYLWCIIAGMLGVSYASSIARMAQESRTWLTGISFVDDVLVFLFAAISLYIWSAAAGVNRKDEVSAGAVALLVMTGYWLLFAGLARFEVLQSAKLAAIGAAAAPAGTITGMPMTRDAAGALPLALMTALFVHGALAARYLGRFGRLAERESFSPRGETADAFVMEKIGRPFRSPLAAIVWKQFRESGQIALVGLAAIVGIVAVCVIGDPTGYSSKAEYLGGLIAAVSVTFGMAIALVIGIGACLYDVGPQLGTFWRSRPINRDLWFWTKVVTGLGILLLVVYLPTLTALYAAGADAHDLKREPTSFILPAAHLAFFAAAMAMTCLVRHAVYAAILSIPAVVLGPALVLGGLVLAKRSGWLPAVTEGDRWDITEQQILAVYIGGLVISFVINILLAWLAMRFDWGRKSRY